MDGNSITKHFSIEQLKELTQSIIPSLYLCLGMTKKISGTYKSINDVFQKIYRAC